MNKYSGSNFDDFLAEEGILEEVSARAHKRLLALQVADYVNHVNLPDHLLPRTEVRNSKISTSQTSQTASKS